MRGFLRATSAAPLVVTLLLAASTTDQDILAAMGGLDDDAASLSRSQGQATTTSVPSFTGEARGRLGEGGGAGGQASDLSARTMGDDNRGGGVGAAAENGAPNSEGLGVGTGTDLARSLGGDGARQAGPLTHGF